MSTHYSKIFLITTENNDAGQNNRQGFLLSIELNKFLCKKDNLFLFTYTVPKKSEEGIFDSEFEETIFNTNNSIKNLNICCKDGYTKLADKTFKSIKWINENLSFDYLVKCDDTKPITVFPSEPFYDFAGLYKKRIRVQEEGGTSYWNKNYIGEELYPCTLKQFEKWARKRGIPVNSSRFDSSVYYGTWKPYILSRRFCEGIANFGENYAKLYCKDLGGCEDHMVGKMFKDLEITLGLKMK